jgi:hypothetical protein
MRTFPATMPVKIDDQLSKSSKLGNPRIGKRADILDSAVKVLSTPGGPESSMIIHLPVVMISIYRQLTSTQNGSTDPFHE